MKLTIIVIVLLLTISGCMSPDKQLDPNRWTEVVR